MPTSDSSPSAARPYGHRLAALLGIVACLVAVDVLLCFVLEPYGAHTEIVWSEYRKAEELDTIFIGSSTTAYCLDPDVFDDELNSAGLPSRSFNLSTPGQTLDNTLMSLETAYADHEVRRAVICLGYESMTTEPFINSAIAVTQAKSMHEGPLQVLSNVGRLVFFNEFFSKEYSLTCAFPWTYNHVEYTVDDILDNVHNRLSYDVIEAGEHYAERVKDSDWLYRSRGFGGVHYTLPSSIGHTEIAANNKGTVFSEQNIASLKEICAFCQDHDIELYVVGSPYTFAMVYTYGEDYLEGMRYVQQLVEDAGGHYFDLNMIHRDVLDLRIADFCDRTHVSNDGAPRATATIAQVIGSIEKGEDVQGLFYSYTDGGWHAYCDAVTYVDAVDYTEERADSQTTLTAYSYTGNTTPVEYKLELLDPTTNTWETRQDWSTSPIFTLPHAWQQVTKVRIYARSTNGSQDVTRSVEGAISL